MYVITIVLKWILKQNKIIKGFALDYIPIAYHIAYEYKYDWTGHMYKLWMSMKPISISLKLQ